MKPAPDNDNAFDFPEPKQPITVLVPTPVANYCYLSEALYFVAFQRFPLVLPWDNGDRRVDTEDMDSIEPRVEFEPVSDDECKRAGLPPNPEYAAYMAGEYHSSPELTENLLRIEGEDEEARRELEEKRVEWRAEIAAAKLHFKAVEDWTVHFDEYMDLPRSRLFIALREGKILGVGKPLPREHYESFPDPLTSDEWGEWVNQPWERISAKNWLSSGIDWESCRAIGGQNAHALILVSFEQLLAAFPVEPEPEGQAVRVGDSYLIPDQAAVARGAKRGRPSFDWDAFHLEMARRLTADKFPTKQEALIADMQVWCLNAWGRRVGRSTLLQKIRPYYSAFMRASENSADRISDL